MEKKCENCVFCAPKPDNLSFMPNDWVCGSLKSKWRGYWPPTGVCENYKDPTGKTIEEVLGNSGKGALEGLQMMLNAMWGNNSTNDYVKKFLKEDSAILDEYCQVMDNLENL